MRKGRGFAAHFELKSLGKNASVWRTLCESGRIFLNEKEILIFEVREIESAKSGKIMAIRHLIDIPSVQELCDEIIADAQEIIRNRLRNCLAKL